jgi:hypothetical protein
MTEPTGASRSNGEADGRPARSVSLPRRILIGGLKVLALAFFCMTALVQLPELTYDLGPGTPVEVSSPEELTAERFGSGRERRSTFVSVEGRADFDRAFVYTSHGIRYTYFPVEPYGTRLVCRTHEKVTDEWKAIGRFVGRLRPYRRMPFSRSVRRAFADEFGAEVRPDAFFLAMDDVPRPSGWQVGALVFSAAAFGVLLYLFFIRPRRSGRAAADGVSGQM